MNKEQLQLIDMHIERYLNLKNITIDGSFCTADNAYRGYTLYCTSFSEACMPVGFEDVFLMLDPKLAYSNPDVITTLRYGLTHAIQAIGYMKHNLTDSLIKNDQIITYNDILFDMDKIISLLKPIKGIVSGEYTVYMAEYLYPGHPLSDIILIPAPTYDLLITYTPPLGATQEDLQPLLDELYTEIHPHE